MLQLLLAAASLAFAGAPTRLAPPTVSLNAPQPLKLVIMGPPASGKGTHAQRLAAEYGLVHVGAGDLLREKAKTDPVIAETMRRGDLVPTPLIVSLVSDRLSQPDVQQKGFILDGFPRRMEEAKALKQLMDMRNQTFDAAIKLDAPEPVLLQRILARGRADDTEPTFRNRMKVYKKETVPAMRHVSQGTKVLHPKFSPDDTIDDAYAKVKAQVEKIREARERPPRPAGRSRRPRRGGPKKDR